jgi:hypothetical protein
LTWSQPAPPLFLLFRPRFSGAAYASDRILEYRKRVSVKAPAHRKWPHYRHLQYPPSNPSHGCTSSEERTYLYSNNPCQRKTLPIPIFYKLDWEECAVPSLQAHSTWSKPDSNLTSSAKSTQRSTSSEAGGAWSCPRLVPRTCSTTLLRQATSFGMFYTFQKPIDPPSLLERCS